MRLALDTNRYTDLCRGESEVTTWVEGAQEVVLPFVVVGELRAGFALGERGRDNERVLNAFLRKPGVAVAYATNVTTRTYASVYRQLRLQGTPIPTNDLWIAAIVVELGLTLCTRDAHFRHLPMIDVV